MVRLFGSALAMRDDAQIPQAQAGDTMDVRRLCVGIRRGDEASLTCLYRAWHMRAIALARTWSGLDAMTCEDVAHELFLRVIRSLPELETAAALDAWMTVTLRRIVLDTLRSRARAHARTRRIASSASVDEQSSPDAGELGLRIEALEEHEREALRIRMTTDGTLAQLAAALHVSPDQFYGRVRRALARLRSMTENDHD